MDGGKEAPSTPSTSTTILSQVAKRLNTEQQTCLKQLKRTQRDVARVNHEKMRMIITNPRQQLISLVMCGSRAQWRVCDQFGGHPIAFMGLTTRLAQLFFNSTDDSPFGDVVEDIEPITVGPIMGDDVDGEHALDEVVHSRQHSRRNAHKTPRVARDTSNGGSGGDDINSSSYCKCRGIEHGRLVHEELMQLILQWSSGGQFTARLDNKADAMRRVRGRSDEYAEGYSSSSADAAASYGSHDDLSERSDTVDEITLEQTRLEASASGAPRERSFTDLRSEDEQQYDADTPDCCTLKIIQYLGCNSLMPLRAELAVFDRQCRTATAIDIVALHLPTWQTVFIEVKTGYGGAVNTPGCFTGHARSGKMRNALSGIDDTPLQRAAAQMLGSFLLLTMGERYDRGSVIVGKPQQMCILHVNPHTVKPIRYAMPEWTFDKARIAAMYENMCAAARLETRAPRALLPTHPPTPQTGSEHHLPQMDMLMDVRKRRRATAEERELERRRREVKEARERGLY